MRVRLDDKNIAFMDEANKEFQALLKAASSETLREGLNKAGEIIKRGAISRLKSDAKSGTGTLANSLEFRVCYSRDGKPYYVAFGWRKILKRTAKRSHRAKGRYKGVTYTSDYGPILEFDSRRTLRHMRKGFDEANSEAVTSFESLIRQRMDGK